MEQIQDNQAGTIEEVSTPPESHTMPTQEELAAQARLSPLFIAAERHGSCCCEARRVEGGFAYRLYGADEHSPWKWMRSADMERDFDLFNTVDTERWASNFNSMYEKMVAMQAALRVSRKAMGKKSMRRFQRSMQQIVDSIKIV